MGRRCARWHRASLIDLTRRSRPDRLEHRDDIQRLAIQVTGQDRASIHEHRRQVEPSRGHQHARQGLVAAGERDERIEPLRVHHGLHRIGDDLAADQRGTHPLVAHGDAVTHRDRRELDGEATGGAYSIFGPFGQPPERHVARGDFVPRRRHTDLRLLPVVVGHADGPQHRPGRCALVPVGHFARSRPNVDRLSLVRHGRAA